LKLLNSALVPLSCRSRAARAPFTGSAMVAPSPEVPSSAVAAARPHRPPAAPALRGDAHRQPLRQRLPRPTHHPGRGDPRRPRPTCGPLDESGLVRDRHARWITEPVDSSPRTSVMTCSAFHTAVRSTAATGADCWHPACSAQLPQVLRSGHDNRPDRNARAAGRGSRRANRPAIRPRASSNTGCQ
jgi:hypothetical protein